MKQLFALFFMLAGAVAAQVPEQKLDSLGENLILIEGDSIFKQAIDLEEVYIFGRLDFASKKEKLRYYILRRKTLKVYPYAKLAAERLLTLNERLEKIQKKAHKKKYTKRVQKYIEGEFSSELKKLTRTEGQILVKLIYRQTGTTAFGLVKNLRNGWRAFWYNTTAKMFNISLKEEFHPDEVHEDYLIEDILQRAFAAGRLEKQKSALDYDFAKLSNHWRNSTVKK